MTGSRDTETILREALSAHTRGIGADPTFVRSAIDHSASTLRQTRRRQLAVAAGGIAAVAVLAAWQVPSIVQSDGQQPTTPPDNAGITDASSWAQSLPRGSDAEVAYVDGRTLVNGSKRVDLGSARYSQQLLATLPGGWLSALEPDDMADATVYGYLRPDGQFTTFDFQPAKGAISGVAASPDGTEVVYAGAIVRTGFTQSGGFDDAVMGSKVADMPAQARVVVEWVEGGLVYRDARHRFWLWSPAASQPTRLTFDGVAPGGYGYRGDGDCVDVTAVEAAPANQRVFQPCDQGHPLTVSDDTRALMSSGEFVNLEAGVDFLTLPAGVLPEQLQLFWETDDSLILVVHDTVGQPTPTVLVRCLVSAGRCERASDPLTGYPQLASLVRSGH
jgi:hypothetical protein